jgi:hypothetical protein
MGKISDFISSQTLKVLEHKLNSNIAPYFEEQIKVIVRKGGSQSIRLFALDDSTIQILSGLFYSIFYCDIRNEYNPLSKENSLKASRMEELFLVSIFGNDIGTEAFKKLLEINYEKNKMNSSIINGYQSA